MHVLLARNQSTNTISGTMRGARLRTSDKCSATKNSFKYYNEKLISNIAKTPYTTHTEMRWKGQDTWPPNYFPGAKQALMPGLMKWRRDWQNRCGPTKNTTSVSLLMGSVVVHNSEAKLVKLNVDYSRQLSLHPHLSDNIHSMFIYGTFRTVQTKFKRWSKKFVWFQEFARNTYWFIYRLNSSDINALSNALTSQEYIQRWKYSSWITTEMQTTHGTDNIRSLCLSSPTTCKLLATYCRRFGSPNRPATKEEGLAGM